MKSKQKDSGKKAAFVGFLIASICFYVSAITGMNSKDGGYWIVNLCLGSSFLCLSMSCLSKGKNRDEDKDREKDR